MIDRNNLKNKSMIIGNWFLPDSDKKIPGVFLYSDGQSSLNLLQPFEQLYGKSTDYKTYHTVYGETATGYVTLTDVIFGVLANTGSVHYAIFGKFLDENHLVNSLDFHLDYLSEWAISKYPLKDYFHPPTIPPLEKYDVNVNGITCGLRIYNGGSVHINEGLRFYTNSSFHLYSKEGKDISDFIDIYNAVESLLRIMTGRNLKPIKMTTNLESRDHNVFLPVDQTEEFGSDRDHLFNFPIIRDNYDKVFGNWFKYYFENRYLIEIFMRTTATKYISPLDFFGYAAILDGYCKSIYGVHVGDYKQRITKVFSVFPETFSNMDEFIDKVDELRHDNFHLNKREGLDVNTMNNITMDLYFLIRIILAKQIGVDLTKMKGEHFPQFGFLKVKFKIL